jgi:hypothetical protein
LRCFFPPRLFGFAVFLYALFAQLIGLDPLGLALLELCVEEPLGFQSIGLLLLQSRILDALGVDPRGCLAIGVDPLALHAFGLETRRFTLGLDTLVLHTSQTGLLDLGSLELYPLDQASRRVRRYGRYERHVYDLSFLQT